MRIAVADHHTILRDGLALILGELDGNVEVVQASSFESLRAVLDAPGAVDLVLLADNLPDASAGRCLRALAEARPELRVVVLAGSDGHDAATGVLALGAAGCIPKTTGARTLLSALRLVLAGGRYVPVCAVSGQGGEPAPSAAQRPGSDLTEREAEVLELLRNGMPNKVIADKLGVGEGTVKSHLCKVFRKLGVHNRVQAARVAAARAGAVL